MLINQIFALNIFNSMSAIIKKTLSNAEVKIMNLLEKGMSNKAISSHCKISENTVKFHLKNIYKKLKVNSRAKAICKYKSNQN